MVAALKALLLCAVIALAGAITGCGSLTARTCSDDPGIYPGPRLDGHWVQDPGDQPMNALIFPIDLPLSTALDTILLPYDIFRLASRHNANTNSLPNDPGCSSGRRCPPPP
jgi:uncharacterized protein YceK